MRVAALSAAALSLAGVRPIESAENAVRNESIFPTAVEWSKETFAEEQIRGLVWQVFSSALADLTDRLRYLMTNPSVREAAGRSARNRIEDHYQWQKIAEDIEAAYFEVLGKKPAIGYQKKTSSTPAIAAEDLPLRRRAG